MRLFILLMKIFLYYDIRTFLTLCPPKNITINFNSGMNCIFSVFLINYESENIYVTYHFLLNAPKKCQK